MLDAHRTVGIVVIAVCAAAAFTGLLLYLRSRGAGPIASHLLALAQTVLVAQVGIGLLLLADDRRAPDGMHYTYGALALGVALSPWFYAPAAGPKRLLWFAGTAGVAVLLAARAYVTGS